MSLFSRAVHTATAAVKSTVSQPLNVVKKIAEVNAAGAVGVASGFATGGVKGAITGGITAGALAINDVSKTHAGASFSTVLKHSVEAGAISGVVTSVAAPGVTKGVAALKNASLPNAGGFQGFTSVAWNAVKSGSKGIAEAGLALLAVHGSKQSAPNDGAAPVTDKSDPWAGSPTSVDVNVSQPAAPPVQGADFSAAPAAGTYGGDAPSDSFSRAAIASPLVLATIAIGVGLLLFKRRT